ncbi:hypothetical protein C9374_001210 [Naegleria lovaniensis]|uniref:EGF-like domain-containing protein n=1 Tax=Naegleria lovaniensis TaxID=51637 RepID=A0AA88GSL3_NAELO|nr:uncharacterized protein C9374_001210 [Naegleria lovaniensis]KAG2387616.1 hypothetical protein C9374_001210 [Naegleria lovaniensis]
MLGSSHTTLGSLDWHKFILVSFLLLLLLLTHSPNSWIHSAPSVKYIITTVAGNGNQVYQEGCVNALECGMFPFALHVTSNLEIYYSDSPNKRIMKISKTGKLSTIAGNSTAPKSTAYVDNIPAVNAHIQFAAGVYVHPFTQDVYFADTFTDKIRKVSNETGLVTTFAGTGADSSSGDGGHALNASLWRPMGIYMNHTTNEMFITESYGLDGLVRKVFSNGTITTIAGKGNAGDGSLAVQAHLFSPCAVHQTMNGDVFILDKGDHVLRRIDARTGIISKIAGIYSSYGYNGDDIPATSAKLFNPFGFTVAENGDVYIADYANCRIRYINASTGNITTIAGNGTEAFSGDGGLATNAAIFRPSSIVRMPTGHLYFTDFFNRRIRLLTPTCDDGFVYVASNHSCADFECFGIKYNDSRVCHSHGNCSNLDVCSCQEGYVGKACEIPTCDGIRGDNATVCSSHGTCTSFNNCTCHEGYTGNECNIPICFGYRADNSTVCSSKGICTSFNNCSCVEGYTGNECQTSICYGVRDDNLTVCSSHGVCSSFNNCTCHEGYTGNNCDTPICYGTNGDNTTVCSSHGTCSSHNNCTCYEGYTGNECQTSICYGVRGDNLTFVCSSHGTCTSFNNCTCHEGYTGDRCDIPICFGYRADDVSHTCSTFGNCVDRDTCACLRNDIFFKDCSLLWLNSQTIALKFTQTSSQTTNTEPTATTLQLGFEHQDFLKFYNGKVLHAVLELQLNELQVIGNVTAFIEIWDGKTSLKISNKTQSLNYLQVVNAPPPKAISSPIKNDQQGGVDTVAIAVGISVPLGVLSVVGITTLIVVIVVIFVKKAKTANHLAVSNQIEMTGV